MLIGIICESCAGKTTLADKIKQSSGAEVITGKDYLRMAKTGSEAEALFRENLLKAVTGENTICVISDTAHAALLPDGAVRILVSADLDTIKERFRSRMHGNLPAPVEQMLERKHGMFDDGDYDFRYDGVCGDAEALCEELKRKM